MSVIEYQTPQGIYAGQFEYDPEADLFHGEVLNTRAVLTFQGRSIDELKTALKDTVDDYLEWCEKRGKDPDKPFSGKFVVRVDPGLHRELAIAASREHKSVSKFVREALAKAVATD